VAGAGRVEACTQNISVGSQLPGVVTDVYVRVGQKVKAGDPLFLLDSRQVRAELALRESMLKAADAQLAKLVAMPREEEKPASVAKVREAEANLAEREDLLNRNRALFNRRVIGREDLVHMEQTFNAAKAQLERARADDKLLLAGAWTADKLVAQAAVDQARAQVEQSKVDLDRLRVTAPVAQDSKGGPIGELEILQVNVRPGEYVGAPPSQALVVLGNLNRLHVRVDVDEHDIPRFKATAPAKAAVRGGPNREYRLTFDRVEPFVIPKKSLTGDNTERVDTRVLQVIYAIDVNDGSVYVGQQMDAYIDVDGAQNEERSDSEIARR
jgi:multidrug resistance efflux pump